MRSPSTLFALVLLLAPTSAGAAFHLWDIVEVYSNADGSVQYVEFFTNAASEEFLTGHSLSSNAPPGLNNPFVFPNDLAPEAGDTTANHYFLVATPGFAAECDQPFQPDYTFAAANFHSLVSDMLDFASVDTFGWLAGELPTDGYHALHEDFGNGTINRRVEVNSPTNFAGQTCLPEPTSCLLQGAGLAAVLGLDRWRRRRARRPSHS